MKQRRISTMLGLDMYKVEHIYYLGWNQINFVYNNIHIKEMKNIFTVVDPVEIKYLISKEAIPPLPPTEI